MSLWVVVGGQYGSEGKGKVSGFITLKEDIDICVRCGGPNSGHSFADEDGTAKVLRQLPTGYINPRTRLLIPAGALIDPKVLKSELDGLRISPHRFGVDRNAMVIEDADLVAPADQAAGGLVGQHLGAGGVLGQELVGGEQQAHGQTPRLRKRSMAA